jgi:hypothetical protein
MFFRDGCRYCTESMEFYRRLGAEPNRARLLVVGREDVDQLRNYVNKNEFHPDGFSSIGTKPVKVSGTPTLLLVTADRTIKGIWPGRLDATAEEEVLKSIRR